MTSIVQPQRLPDFLLSHGRHTVTPVEARQLLGSSETASRRALARLADAGQLFAAGRGLYVVIPPEYRTWGTVPASHFVDDLMRVRERRYYVALLSAAELHGAAHQAPQVFQVLVDRPLAARHFERVRIRFLVGKHVAEHPDESVEVRNTPTGTMRVAGRELTAIDLVEYAPAAGGLDHVATVLAELEGLDGAALAALAARRDRAVARRLGWLLERFGDDGVDLEPLRAVAQPGAGAATGLRPRPAGRGARDPSWGVRVNVDVEPDL